MNNVSAPILDRFNYPLAVVWITGPSSRMPIDKIPELAEHVKACAQKISTVLQNELA